MQLLQHEDVVAISQNQDRTHMILRLQSPNPLVAPGVFSFKDGLALVIERAKASSAHDQAQLGYATLPLLAFADETLL